MIKKNVVAGLGEIGGPILKLLSHSTVAVGFDINSSLMSEKKFVNLQNTPTEFLHICIPFTPKFISNVISLNKKFNPECIIIHSTVSPNTTITIQKKLTIPVIYSATRGIHRRMIYDLRRYTKFYAIEPNAPRKNWASTTYERLLRKCKIRTKRISNPLTLELAKIVVDTSYYGWLITYAQISNMIALKHKVNYDEMWSFADEIHRYLGNRPKMYPGIIGGHCVIPNLSLINEQNLEFIKKLNTLYGKKILN